MDANVFSQSNARNMALQKGIKLDLQLKGFTQTHGIDYLEIFALVAKIISILLLLSLIVNTNEPLFQLDMRNVFPDGDLEEEVFMSLSP